MAFHELVENQRRYFNTGETKKIEVRRQHLNTLRKALEENRDKFCEAVYNDHRRAKELTSSIEIDGSLAELDYFLANFEKWSEPVPVERTPVLSQDDVPMLVKDPVGVVLVIGPWNYPVVLVMAPLMAALAAGNTVVIKPSEVSANTSKVFDNVMGKYFDKGILDRSKALPLIKTGELDRNDIFIPPLVVDVKANDAFMEDKIFGPVLPVLTTENLDKTVKHISGGENPLAVYVFTNSKDVMKKIWSETHGGAALGNDIMSH
ncbi:hypothetical protein L596_012539 [Steinernema carpocapsae]|nr:hypothetical protein L596_012539 [Steinernema carpocapsae]